eukprot:1831720-Pyramimonas_sp.AAC.1
MRQRCLGAAHASACAVPIGDLAAADGGPHLVLSTQRHALVPFFLLFYCLLFVVIYLAARRARGPRARASTANVGQNR